MRGTWCCLAVLLAVLLACAVLCVAAVLLRFEWGVRGVACVFVLLFVCGCVCARVGCWHMVSSTLLLCVLLTCCYECGHAYLYEHGNDDDCDDYDYDEIHGDYKDDNKD